MKQLQPSSVDLHRSKPLISLVPFTLHRHCFQGQGHCYVTIPIVFPSNHQKQSFKEVRDRPPSLYKSYVWPYVSQTLQHVTMVTLSFAKNVNECFNCTAAIQFRSFHQVRQRKRRKMWKICNKIWKVLQLLCISVTCCEQKLYKIQDSFLKMNQWQSGVITSWS